MFSASDRRRCGARLTTSALLGTSFIRAPVWRWSLGLATVLSLGQIALLRWMPEVPQWLEETVGRQPPRGPTVQHLFQRKYLRPILLALSIAMFNQLTGVNIFRMYLLDLLSNAGIRHEESYAYAISISVLRIGFTLAALLFIDARGRKPLLIVGSVGMALCLVSLASPLQHHADPKMYDLILSAYNASFAFSQGPMIWVYLSELFPLPVRGDGQALGSLVHWLTSASVILCFPVVQRALPSGVFLILAAIMCLQAAVVARWYPETKGIVLGELESPSRPLKQAGVILREDE